MRSLKELLEIVVKDGATDLHISVGNPPMVRVNGVLVPRGSDIIDAKEAQNICLSLMTEKQRRSFEGLNEIDFSFGVKDLARFRVNVFKQRGFLSAAIRRIPDEIPPFSKLGLPSIIADLTKKNNGMILVTGPTGSGKSTTIASLLDKINEEEKGHIVTIEDPIEYAHRHRGCVVNQREIGFDTDSFESGMRSLLRQDPDYCLVGEMRDRETAEIALKISETGHLLFATLHTNSAPDTISRVVAMFEEGRKDIILSQLSSCLQAIVCQQLLPGLDGKLVLAYELLIPTSGIRALIREKKIYQIHGMMQVGQQNTGMITMNQCLMNLIIRRKIDMKIGFEASSDPEELNSLLKKGWLLIMPLYSYQAKSMDGKVIKGQLDAATDIEARVKLRAQRFIPIKLIEATGGGEYEFLKGFSNFRSRVKSKDLQIFTRQFATLINSGIPIVQSLEILGNSTSNELLASSIKKVKEDIEGGKKLGDALNKHPRIFDRLYVNLMRAGEESGSIDQILERLAGYIEKSIKIKNKVAGAMYYPAGILIVAFIVIVVILTFVIPKFEELFKTSGQEIPWLTKMVVNASHFMLDYWYLVFGFVFLMVWMGFSFYRSDSGKRICDNYFIRFPLFGPLIQKSGIARFSRTFATMISCGVPILEGLDISARVVGNSVLETTFLKAKDVIQSGKSMVIPLAQDPYIPDMVVQMIGVGEQTGALDTMLGKIADFYEEEVEYAVGALTAMIEPIMMVFLGGIIAVLVIAMYLPIFNLASGFSG